MSIAAEIVSRIAARVEGIVVLRRPCEALARWLHTVETALSAAAARGDAVPSQKVLSSLADIHEALAQTETIVNECHSHPLVVASMANKYIAKLQANVSTILESLAMLRECEFVTESVSHSVLEELREKRESKQLRLELSDLIRLEQHSVPEKLQAMLRKQGFCEPLQAVRDFLQLVAQLQAENGNSERDDAIKQGGTGLREAICQDLLQLSSGPPSFFLCPLTGKIMEQPVLLVESGISYEREAILAYIAEHNRPPVDDASKASEALQSATLILNTRLSASIQLWKQEGNRVRLIPFSPPSATSSAAPSAAIGQATAQAQAFVQSKFSPMGKVQWAEVLQQAAAILVLSPPMQEELEEKIRSQSMDPEWVSCPLAEQSHSRLLVSCRLRQGSQKQAFPYCLLAISTQDMDGTTFKLHKGLSFALPHPSTGVPPPTLYFRLPNAASFAPVDQIHALQQKTYLDQVRLLLEAVGCKKATFLAPQSEIYQTWQHPLFARPHCYPSLDLATQTPWNSVLMQRSNEVSQCQVSCTIPLASLLSADWLPSLRGVLPTCLLEELSVEEGAPQVDFVVDLQFFGRDEYMADLETRVLPAWGIQEFLGYAERAFPELLDYLTGSVFAVSTTVSVAPPQFTMETVRSLVGKGKPSSALLQKVCDRMEVSTVSHNLYNGSIEEWPSLNSWKARFEIEHAHQSKRLEQTEMIRRHASARVLITAAKMPVKNPDRFAPFDAHVRHVLVGDSQVGKTALLMRWAKDSYRNAYSCTTALECIHRTDRLCGLKVDQAVWDTCGHERYRATTLHTFRGAMSIYLIYDVTNRSSFEGLKKWMSSIRQHAAEHVMITILGNKCDQEHQRAVSAEEGAQFAKSFGCVFFEVSAKQDIQVAMAFQIATCLLLLGLLNVADACLEASMNNWYDEDAEAKARMRRSVCELKEEKRKHWCILL